MPHPLDALARLLPLSWRGIEVPCQQNGLRFNQRLVEHKQHGVSGAHVENCGRDSARFSFRIPFRGGISGYTDLYPSRFRQFWDACLDGSVGVLVHPEFGSLDCKVESLNLVYDPNRRDGVDVDIEWVETIEGDISLETAANSPINDAIKLAVNLETILTKPRIPKPNEKSLFEQIRSTVKSIKEGIAKINGQIQLAQYSVVSVMADIEGVVNAANDLTDTAAKLTDPDSSAIYNEGLAIVAAMQKLGEKLPSAAPSKTVTQKVLTKLTAVVDAASQFSMSLNEFFALNPTAALAETINPGTILFVYEAR